jgi:FlaG/FlaF family flagellin (archaellin)
MNNYSKSYRLALGIAIVLILATVLVTGCRKASVSSGVISEISISTAVDSNNRPINPTTVFSTDAEGFYCSFKVSGFPIGSKLQAQWIYVGGDPEAEMKIGKNYAAEMQTATITTEGQGYTSTVYSAAGMPDYTWPKGDYKVVISVDGQEKGSTTFKVQ